MSSFILSQGEIREIHAIAVELGLHINRDRLVQGMPPTFVARLPRARDDASQLLGDLGEMNRNLNLSIVDGATPLAIWLSNAAYLSSDYPARQNFFNAKAITVAEMAARANAPPDEPGQADRLERIIYRNDLLPAGFLDGASRVAASVVRLTVPVYRGATARRDNLGSPLITYGTGWLIGERHLVTNHHVVASRSAGEATATADEFKLQAEHSTADFDYLSDANAPKSPSRIVRAAAYDLLLDYAILELAEAVTDREPLVLAVEPLAVVADAPVPVNIIQHPRGAPKQLALRNNLVAAVTGPDLAYFTDTDGGSSGAPVADDRWRVVALHKASTLRFGNLVFQGKTTAWVNVGTPIHLIVADLSAKEPQLWREIGARFA